MNTPLEELAWKIAEKYALEEEGGVWKVSKDVIDELTASFLKIHREALEEAAKVAENHYEDHCCKDCSCSYWRENTAKTIRKLLKDSK